MNKYYHYYFTMSCVGASFDMTTQSKSKHFEAKLIGVFLETIHKTVQM